MRPASLLVALFGIVIAGGSVWFAQSHLTAPRNAAAEEIALAKVWVAAHELPAGAAVTAADLRAIDWPANALPDGAITDPAQIVGERGSGKEPRRARHLLVAGDLIVEAKLGGFGEDVSLINKLGSNTRAMSIKADAVTAVGGFITPGDRVDVVLTQGNYGELRAATILQDVRVIGVDQSVSGTAASGAARTITLEVTPGDSQKLALAQRAGTLSLTLRTLDGAQDATLDQITLNDLLGQEEAPTPRAAPSAPVRTVRERRGTDSSIINLN